MSEFEYIFELPVFVPPLQGERDKKNTLPTCSTKSESNISDELNFRCGITFDQQPMLRKDVKISLHQEIGCSWRLSRFRSFSFSKFPRTGRFWNQFSTVPNIKQNKLSSARFAHAMISKITFQQEGRVNPRFLSASVRVSEQIRSPETRSPDIFRCPNLVLLRFPRRLRNRMFSKVLKAFKRQLCNATVCKNQTPMTMSPQCTRLSESREFLQEFTGYAIECK